MCSNTEIRFMKLPKISTSLPTLNEEKYIKICLDSINSLDYPKNKIEVFVVDAGSRDNTLEIARKYPFVKIIKNPEKDTHIGKMLGLKAASGKYWMYFDADLQLNGKNWAKVMVKPLEEDKNIAACSSAYHPRKGDSMIENYINLDPIGRDTLFAWFTPSIQSTIKEQRNGYAVCEYKIGKIPPQGMCLYRTALLKKYVGNLKRFRELDTLQLLTSKGYNKYAYVPDPGYYHKHPQSLSALRKKRKRNATKNYIPGNKEGYLVYTWFDLSNPKDFLKMCILIVYSFSIIGPLIVGIYKSIKYHTVSGMVECVYVPVAVEAYLEAFLCSRDGRKFIKRQLTKLIRKVSK